MTTPRRLHTDHDGERLSKTRANQAHNEIVQQVRAVRTVDGHAIDSQDRAMLIAMLGLDGVRTPDARTRHVGPLT
jgi:hypothetical protein